MIRSLAVTACVALPAAAHAESFDLTGFVDREGADYILDEPSLVLGLEDVVASMRPAFGSSGRTSGTRGFVLELGLGWTPIGADSETWTRALGDDAPDALSTLHIEARKGLPAGFELSAAVAHSSALELTSASFGFRWAWLEGVSGVPDLGIRLDGGAIVGDSELTLATAGIELVIGYPVPVAGLFRLAPYAGYSFRFGASIERRVAILDDVSAKPFVTVLPSQSLFLSHALVGLRGQAGQLDIGLEAMLGTTVGLVFQLGARL